MSDPLPSPSIKHDDHGPRSAFGLIFGPDYGTPISMSCQQNEQCVENEIHNGSKGEMHLLEERNFFVQQDEQHVVNDVPDQHNGGMQIMDENNFFGKLNEQFLENDTPNKSNGGMDIIDVNNSLRLVLPGETGEGLPYAPVDWPNPGDNWIWRVGRRVSSSGYFQDRFIYPPKRLQGKRKQMFASKASMENFVRSQFPGADVEALFSSFTWKVPGKIEPPSKSKVEAAPPAIESPTEDVSLEVQEGKVENPRYGRRERKQIVPKFTEKVEEKNVKTPRSSQRKRKQDSKQDAPTSTTSKSKRKGTRSSKRFVPPAADESGISEPETANVIPEGFDNYLSSLEDILSQPLPETQASYPAGTSDTPISENDMAKARSKLSALLVMDFPSLVSSRNVSKLVTLASKLRKDPTLSAEQLVKLKLIEEIPSFSEVFLESRQTIEQISKFFTTLEANKNKVNALKNEYNELKEKADQLQAQVDGNLLTVQEIDNQILQLQNWRAELTNTIENNETAKVEVASAQGMVANAIPTVVRDIQVANSKIPEWELKRINAEKRETEVLEKFAPLRGFSL